MIVQKRVLSKLFRRDPTVLSLCLRDMERVLQDGTVLLSSSSSTPPEGYVPCYSLAVVKKERKAEGHLMNEIEILMRAVEETYAGSSIAWIHRANSLSISLRHSGFLDESLALRRISHPIIHKLYLQHEDIYAPDLAVSYHNLSSDLASKKKWKESLTVMQSSLDIRRELVEKDPRFKPLYAGTVLGIGHCLSNLRRYKEAMQYVNQAIDMWKELSVHEPISHRTDLVRAYHKLGYCLSESGRHESSIEPYRTGLAITREVVKHDASATSVLASLLNNLGYNLSYIGRPYEAFPLLLEAVNINRNLARDEPKEYANSLRMSENNLLKCRRKMKSANVHCSPKST